MPSPRADLGSRLRSRSGKITNALTVIWCPQDVRAARLHFERPPVVAALIGGWGMSEAAKLLNARPEVMVRGPISEQMQSFACICHRNKSSAESSLVIKKRPPSAAASIRYANARINYRRNVAASFLGCIAIAATESPMARAMATVQMPSHIADLPQLAEATNAHSCVWFLA